MKNWKVVLAILLVVGLTQELFARSGGSGGSRSGGSGGSRSGGSGGSRSGGSGGSWSGGSGGARSGGSGGARWSGGSGGSKGSLWSGGSAGSKGTSGSSTSSSGFRWGGKSSGYTPGNEASRISRSGINSKPLPSGTTTQKAGGGYSITNTKGTTHVDSSGRVKAFTDARSGKTTNYRNDGSKAQVIKKDANGNVKSTTDFKKNGTVVKRDASGAVTSVSYNKSISRGGQAYTQRTTIVNGRTTVHNYYSYSYGGHPYYGYSPLYVYHPFWYGYMYHPFYTPFYYTWAWVNAPWYSYYGYYYHPYASYSSGSLWLTDYVLANSIAQANMNSNASSNHNGTAMTDEMKEQIKNQVEAELQNQENAAKENKTPNALSLQQILEKDPNHLFIIQDDMDVTDIKTSESCELSGGDLVKVKAGAPIAETATLIVVHGKKESCDAKTEFVLSTQEVVDLYNKFTESIDKGSKELHDKQGQDGIPKAPKEAAGEPTKTVTDADVAAAETEAKLKAEEVEAPEADDDVADPSGSSW